MDTSKLHGHGRRVKADAGRTGAPRLPFGRHKGRSVRVVPTGYLHWLSGLSDLREPFRSEVREELALRAERGAQLDLAAYWTGDAGKGGS